MSLLTLVQRCSARLSLIQPTACFGSTDLQVLQWIEIANTAGEMLASAAPWQALRTEFTFSSMYQTSQTGAIPSDFDRWIDNTQFNRSTRRPMAGPITPRQWQWIQAQPIYASVYLAWIERGGQFLVAPKPPAGQTIAFEYISKNWVQAVGGGYAAAFAADSDVSRLDERLLRLGMLWRYLQAKGLDYAEAMDDYERELEKAIARDGGASMMNVAPQPMDPRRANLPDGSFGA